MKWFDVKTIGDFGHIQLTWRDFIPKTTDFSWSKIGSLLPYSISIAITGLIESILTFVAGFLLLCITLFFPSVISMIPMPALIASMLYIVYETGDWKALFKRFDKNYLVTIITAGAATFTHNLSIGVVLGSVLHILLEKYT